MTQDRERKGRLALAMIEEDKMQARIALACSVLLSATCTDHAVAAQALKRSIQGISTGMTMEQAWTVAIKNGGRCAELWRGSSQFSCRFDRLTLFVYKTVFMNPARVKSLAVTFQPSQMGADLSGFMKEQFDLVREVGPDGRPLPWRRLASGESVDAFCMDKAPGIASPQPLNCHVTLTDARVIAADRDIALHRK